MNPITGIKNAALDQLAKQADTSASNTAGAGKKGDFAQTLMDVLKEVNDSQLSAKKIGEDFMTNRQSVDIHDLKIAMERAGITLNLTLAVRNKLLEAYQEINRIQV